jgi:HSP20 family protein
MAIVRWDPARQLAATEIDRLNRMFDDLWGGRDLDAGRCVPPVDIFETEHHDVVIKAELPGMRREDIDLQVENNALTIKGERRQERTVSKEQYHRAELAYGAFSRSFSLPNTVDTERVRAEYADGILTVTLPLREDSKPKQIKVEIKS